MSKPTLPKINMSQCTLCGACVDGCPEGALVYGSAGAHLSRPVQLHILHPVRGTLSHGRYSSPINGSLVSGRIN